MDRSCSGTHVCSPHGKVGVQQQTCLTSTNFVSLTFDKWSNGKNLLNDVSAQLETAELNVGQKLLQEKIESSGGLTAVPTRGIGH